jgi:type I restriction enzyme M protein
MNTSHIWAVADLLRGDYKQSEYGKVILPFTVLRRLDCVLEKTKDAVLAQAKNLPAKIDAKMKEVLLNKAAGANFHNVSEFTLQSLLNDSDNIKENLTHYIQSFNQDYMLSNPPFGVEWKKVEKFIKDEANTQAYCGRFGAGLPRVSDGSLLFVQHMISKMSDDGSRIAVVLNGSPLFTGGAGSGESEIRRWIIENDWLEAIIALPSDLFYNTGIATYIWIMTNKKTAQRAGKIQLINASEFYTPMRKSLGKKRHEIAAEQIKQITKLFSDFAENALSQIFDNADFGYQRVTVERPLRLNFCMGRIDLIKATKGFQKFSKAEQEAFLKALGQIDSGKIFKNREQFVKVLNKALKAESLKLSAAQLKWVLAALSEPDESADICKDKKGNPEPDPDLRDYENVPLKEDVQVYFEREVLPYVPEAWIDHSKTKVGYEIPFNRHFYQYVPPRSLAEIDADLDRVSSEIMALLKEVHV